MPTTILKQQQLQQETCSQSFQICQFDKKTCGKNNNNKSIQIHSNKDSNTDQLCAFTVTYMFYVYMYVIIL